MKVILTGGGTGGHFYPLVAVAEELNNIIDEENLADSRLYFLAPDPYDKKALYENGIVFKQITAGKMRTYFSLQNFFDIFKVGIGILQAIFTVFAIFPDVVFSKGGYGAFPTVFAARLLGIPVIVHESDSVPGRVNIWASKFAKAIAVSYKQTVDYFPKEKIIHTGQPIRHNLHEPTTEGAHEFLNLESETPILWVLGGSLGAQTLNSVIEETLPQLLPKYQIIHQTGADNFDEIKKLTDAMLVDNQYKYRYHPYPFLNQLSMKMIAGVADVVISRAGSTLFEIAHWEIPAIIVPITNSHKNHQIKNAYNYAREGACIVIEENNLSDSLLVFEVNRIYDNADIQEKMKAGAKTFAIEDASRKIAEEIAAISLKHEEQN